MKAYKFLYAVLVAIAVIITAIPCHVIADSDFDMDFDSTNTMTGGDVNIGGNELSNDFDANMDQSQSNYNYLDFGDNGEIKKVLGNLGGRVNLEAFQPPRVIFVPEANSRKIWYEQATFDQEELLCPDQVNAWLGNGNEIVQQDPMPPRKAAVHNGPIRVINHLPTTGKKQWGWMLQTPINPFLYVTVKVGISGAFAVTNTDTVVVIVRELSYGENAGNYYKPGGNVGSIESILSWGASSAFQTGKGSAMAYPVYHVEVYAYSGVSDAEIYTEIPASARGAILMGSVKAPAAKKAATTNNGSSRKLRGKYIGFNGHLSLSDPKQQQVIAYNVALLQKNWNMINRVLFYSQGVDETYAAEVRLETGARLYASGIPEQEIIAKFAPDKQYRVTGDLRPQLEQRQLTGVVGVIIK